MYLSPVREGNTLHWIVFGFVFFFGLKMYPVPPKGSKVTHTTDSSLSVIHLKFHLRICRIPLDTCQAFLTTDRISSAIPVERWQFIHTTDHILSPPISRVIQLSPILSFWMPNANSLKITILYHNSHMTSHDARAAPWLSASILNWMIIDVTVISGGYAQRLQKVTWLS